MTFILCFFLIQDSITLPNPYNLFDWEFSLFELDSNNLLYLEQRSLTIYLVQMDKQIISEFYRDKSILLDFFVDNSFRIILFYENKIKLMDKNLILLAENLLENDFKNIQLLHVVQNKIYFLNRLNSTLYELDINRMHFQKHYAFNDSYQRMIADPSTIQLIFFNNTYIFSNFFSLKKIIRTELNRQLQIKKNIKNDNSQIIFSKRMRFYTYYINDKLRLYREK